MDWIAEELVIFVLPDGTRSPGRIAVGRPVQRDLDCACTTIAEGLEPATQIFGETTLQALVLAMSFLRIQLDSFVSSGGRILYTSQNLDYDLDDILPSPSPVRPT